MWTRYKKTGLSSFSKRARAATCWQADSPIDWLRNSLFFACFFFSVLFMLKDSVQPQKVGCTSQRHNLEQGNKERVRSWCSSCSHTQDQSRVQKKTRERERVWAGGCKQWAKRVVLFCFVFPFFPASVSTFRRSGCLLCENCESQRRRNQ